MPNVRIILSSVLILFLAAPHLVIAEHAPDFSAPLLDGQRFKLAEALKKGPVLLHFWDTCCPGCREALPLLDSLTTKFGDSLTVVGISTDTPKNQSKVKPFVRSKRYHFIVALDDQMEVRKKFGGTESPLTILISRNGDVVLRHVGVIPEEAKILNDAVRDLLGTEIK